MTRVFTPRSASVDIAAITAAPPDMSVFIVSMPAGRLERQATGVEDHALAHERERLPARAGRRVGHLEETGRLLRSLADTQHATEALRLELLHVEHLHGDAAAAQQLARRGDHVGR